MLAVVAMSTNDASSVGELETDVVVGLGDTGLACARFLHACGRRVLVMDSRMEPPGLASLRAQLPQVPVILGRFDAAVARNAKRLILSPGVAVSEPFIRDAAGHGVEVIGEIELFARTANAPIAGVTGSNGKSTVTRMLADILCAAGRDVRVGGNLGINALDLLCEPAPSAYVVELSSFQLETTRSLKCAVASILNVTSDHMDRYESLAAYAAVKARILDGARHRVVNLDDPIVSSLAKTAHGVHGFTLEGVPGAYARLVDTGEEGLALEVDGEVVMLASAVPVPGRHNLANALAAMAMARLMGVDNEALRRGVVGFKGLPHRCELVIEHAGVRWVNDSKGTNVGATVAAIEGLQAGRDLVLIAGGEGKGQDFSPLAAAVSRHVHTLVLFGRDAAAIDAAIPSDVRRVRVRSLEAAVESAAQDARGGDTVLFSPACASFDMFRNYEARGEAFASLVLARCAR